MPVLSEGRTRAEMRGVVREERKRASTRAFTLAFVTLVYVRVVVLLASQRDLEKSAIARGINSVKTPTIRRINQEDSNIWHVLFSRTVVKYQSYLCSMGAG